MYFNDLRKVWSGKAELLVNEDDELIRYRDCFFYDVRQKHPEYDEYEVWSIKTGLYDDAPVVEDVHDAPHVARVVVLGVEFQQHGRQKFFSAV